MPKPKTWTEDDKARALQWIERKATSTLFRDQAQDIDAHLSRIRQGEDLPATLREILTPQAWKALLNALRQRKHATEHGRLAAREDLGSDDDLADALARAYRALEDAADNLRYHSKNSEDARLRLAAALGDSPQWGPGSTDVKANERTDSRIQRKTVKEISPSMAALDRVGTLGGIKTWIGLEVFDAPEQTTEGRTSSAKTRATSAVKIHTGDFPSAEGAKDGAELGRIVTRWQSVASDAFPRDCSWVLRMVEETDRLRLWERDVDGFTYACRDEFLREKVLIDFDLTEQQAKDLVTALRSG